MTEAADKPSGTGPLFFLSYPRPSATEQFSGDPDRDYIAFYHLLCTELARIAPLDRLHHLGAVSADRRVDGPQADDQAARDLAECDVFVALQSLRYFQSAQCARELAVYRARLGTGAAAPEDAVVRVLWTPASAEWTSSQPPPDPTGEEEVDYEYLAGGLVRLQSGPEPDYRMIVSKLARRIADAAGGRPARASVPANLAAVEGTVARAERQPLLIFVLSPNDPVVPDAVPPRADIGHWNPFAVESRRPLAAILPELAGDKGWHAEIRPFTDDAAELFGSAEPDAPVVLLVDPRALDKAVWRAALQRFDALDRPWAGVVAAWDPHGTDDAEVRRLEDQFRDVLNRKFARRSPSLRIDAPIATSLRILDQVLDATANDARIRFAKLRHRTVRPQVQEGSP